MEQRRTFIDTAFARIIPAAVVMSTIWWLSDRQSLPQPPGLSMQVWSVLAHLGLFGLLGLTIWWALGLNSRLLDRERSWYAIGIATAYGLLDEYHQSFVPGRDPSAMDVLVDFIGALLAVLVIPRLHRHFFG